MKKTWSIIINVLHGFSRKNKFECVSKVFNNITYIDEQYIPQIFNQYFTLPDASMGKNFSDYMYNVSLPNSF